MAELFSDAEIEAATGGDNPPSPEEIAAAALAERSRWSPETEADRAGRPWGERRMYRVAAVR